ncbi:DUF3304 domain-containing protein [Xanthomonas translucens]|uniref:DUF3304 domain-containing protein n=2 Tax=Xanthomonas campestris pv. translucens TaxID=343 RepID=UPI001E5319C7|nr:DUF3304 domain-containing protein [Xanthomonas translucens]MCS3361889.1 DUF3304 domain-containing protein [Xanthomonas translucens pv. translucens]MCS3375446.1 DUF3304 domain-containing protein [Xanthomonas translucens pv. translucens]MCT8276483.1 DUF3304 domain-containing protein [Xanthomonas translucens pv. translucens]MCT8280261.1 DUF3304 domain-containing protein [Xanthomonas translucens pv. translucens]MCT8291436.1 DUF3304 domain-containing protein [Xanthomonas translucens pv. transluc
MKPVEIESVPDSHKHRLSRPAKTRRGLLHRTVLGLSRLLLLCALLPLGACSKPAGEQADGGMATANISPYNHTGDYIHQLYIDGQWGGNARAYGGGGTFVCCISYPRTWKTGLSAKVRWTTSSSDPQGSPEETWHEKVVPIERYEKSGTTLNVHFLPEGQVRLLITNLSAGHPDYPGPPPPQAPPDWPPWEHAQSSQDPPLAPPKAPRR